MRRSFDLSSLAVLGSLLLVWSIAAWAGFNLIGLYSDGAYYFSEILNKDGFTAYEDQPRLFYAALTQIPTVIALRLGLTDLNWLIRIYSFTLLAVPALLYSLALLRARRDDALLALVVGSIATVFLPTCLFSVGEYNIAYATVILAATWLASTHEFSARDGAVLIVLGAMSLRVYEALLYLGPLLAALALQHVPPKGPPALDAVRRQRPQLFIFLVMAAPVALAVAAYQARILFPLACVAASLALILVARLRPAFHARHAGLVPLTVAALCLTSSLMSAASPRLSSGIKASIGVFGASALESGRFLNPQLLLVVAALACVGAGLVLRRRLATIIGSVSGAALMLVLLLLPLAQLRHIPEAPIGSLHFNGRLLCGLLIAAAMVGLLLGDRLSWVPPGSSRPLLAAAFAAAAAVAPSTFFAAREWGVAMTDLRSEVRARREPLESGEAPATLSRWFIAFPGDAKSVPLMSTLLRPAGVESANPDAPFEGLDDPYRWRH